MAIANADLTTGTGFVLSPMNLTDTQKTLVTNIIANIKGNEAGIENLALESQDKLNEVITAVNDLKDGTDTDIATLEDNINAILFLESEAGNDSFTGLFSKLYTAINEKKEALAFTLDVAESPDGRVLLDLTAYGFQSSDEYEVFPSMVTDDSGRSLGVDFKKTGIDGGILTIRDKDRLQFGDNPEARYDAAVKGDVQITVVIVRTAVALKSDLTTVAGDTVHLGHEFSEHITITNQTADDFSVVVSAGVYEGKTVIVTPYLADGTIDDTEIKSAVVGVDGVSVDNVAFHADGKVEVRIGDEVFTQLFLV